MKMKMFNAGKLFAVAALATVSIFAACSDDNNETGPDTQIGLLPNNSVITGNITQNTTLGKGFTYTLKGGVHVKAGATLTIEEGVVVKSDATEPATAYLLIEPGAKIDAEGTAQSPIVFTSGKSNPQPQDWGGIIVCGKAPINPGATAASEMGAGVNYGGTDPNDNSGTLKYVRVEYTGKKQTTTKEHNGFTFEGVGAGTTVEYLSSYRGGDDGIEFFGGTVNAKYIVVYGAQDDMFDWTYGWKGNGQFWVGIQADDVADRGIEADNNGSNNVATPYSEPTISNVTLVGSLSAKTGDDPATATETGKTRAIKLREGTKAKLYNFVVYGFNNGVEVEHDQTLANLADGSLFIKNSDISNDKLWSFKPTGGTFTGVNLFAGANYANTVGTAATPAYISSKYIGTSATGAFDIKTAGAFFTDAKYKGAVSTTNWTSGWAKVQ
jgi:hypothetical protein